MLTEAELAAIRERADKAVPGPWEVDANLDRGDLYLFTPWGYQTSDERDLAYLNTVTAGMAAKAKCECRQATEAVA